MDVLELIKHRRSIRKYEEKQVDRKTLETIIEAGLYAPNAGGAQRSIIIGLQNPELIEKLGKINVALFDRSRAAGRYVSKDQPSIIDDPNIKSGFYGAPTLCIVFGQKNSLYSIPDAFCCADNMVLAAASLDIASCIVARAEDTFDSELGATLMKEWDIPEDYVARCFVLLGYCKGEYPAIRPRKENRSKIID